MSEDTITRSHLSTIEWDMMDKTKFLPLSMLSSFSVRATLYPLTLIKTRLQIQKHGELYKGLFDAANRIYRSEGISGLYRGFWVSSVQVFSGVAYIGAYEQTRFMTAPYLKNLPEVRSLVAGGVASVCGQTIIVPFDVVSQHLMMLGLSNPKNSKDKIIFFRPLGVNLDTSKSKFHITLDIAQCVYQQDGLKGFYRGYIASVCTYAPNSALWWSFYTIFQEQLEKRLPLNTSLLFTQSISGVLAGFTTTLMTNPMDTIRARLQVQRTNSIIKTFKSLWDEEKMMMFTKGLSARLVQSICFSFTIILGYESIKRVSVLQEYKDRVRW
ncbi:solute carrier family 25 member 44 [Daktulosphaira vitifoliae]|uniref:solute carrier family 25 member 44 n=1 Tax=Daktulosphaira vitifoliae TaxID=58002 RepID=UPI0021AAD242|nr:solute carrier family 25 member 44 [Daktulosphaira vitifoliae]